MAGSQRPCGYRTAFIGPLQTNKTRNAVALFDVIQTPDRPKLAQSLAKEMEKADRRLPCYIQINTGEEPQKAGIFPEKRDAFVKARAARRLSAGYYGANVYSAAKRRSIASISRCWPISPPETALHWLLRERDLPRN